MKPEPKEVKHLELLSPKEMEVYNWAITHALDDVADVLEALAKLKADSKPKPECVWTLQSDDEDFYETSCDQVFIFSYRKRDNEFIFCPYCGGKIKEAK